jgi:signal transduction histidine kinase
MVVLAVVLTAPWSLLVIKAAYERDVMQNAQALARRVEWQRAATLRQLGGNIDPWTISADSLLDQQMADSLRAELRSDPTVQSVIFYMVGYDERKRPREPDRVQVIGIVRDEKSPSESLKGEQIAQLKNGPLEYVGEGSHRFLIPLMHKGDVVAVTYVALSKEALSKEFWKKEGPLWRQVMAWTATGILTLSAVGIFGYRSWRRVGHVQQRAELARQGLLAERGLTAAVLAHEIRNPLQALRFQLHSLRKNSQDPGRVTGTAETIDSELLRIQQLVSDYLEHEKAVSMRVQSVNLEEAAQKLKTVLDELLRNSDTRLTIVPPPEPVFVTCDPHALRQILMNLVLNAQQAMGEGGAIIIRIGREDPFGTIDVRDTGPGIPEEMRARLFKPFQTSKRDGHGIGLALVKRFVDNFGGSVTVESEMGKGTTFHLRLPLADADLSAAASVETTALNNNQEVQKIGV